MNNKHLLVVILLFTSLFGVIFITETLVGEQGRKVMHRGVSSSVLRYGTLGNSLAELGLLSGYRENDYLPVHLSTLVEGQARLSFTLEGNVPLSGQVYFWDKDEQGSIGDFEFEQILTDKAGKTEIALRTYSIDDLFAIRFDIDTLGAQVKISDIKIVDQNLGYIHLNKAWAYESLIPNEKMQVTSLDDTSVSFNTLNEGDGDAYMFFPISEWQADFNGFASLFGRKRTQTDISFKTNRLTSSPADIAEVLSQDNWDVPVLSISAPENALNGDYGIITNLQQRGRDYEQLADITYYDEMGKKVYASPVGIRYHGGYNRAIYDSYKFYFRAEYGSTETKQAQMFTEPLLPINSFVLHHTQFPEYSPIGHLLAIDLFEAMGIDTPRRLPAMVYLNGEQLGFYYITDHLAKRNFDDYFGTDDFRFYRFKSYNTNENIKALNDDLSPIEKYQPDDGVFPEDVIYEKFDVEAITNFMIANTILNVHDYCQGVLYRRDDLNDQQWRMVGWDFDGSFFKVNDWTVPNWQDTFNIVGEAYSSTRDCPYQIIFRKLMRNSAKYRAYFKQRFDESLETVFSTQSMQARLASYREEYQGKFGVDKEGLDMLEEYFEKRPDFVRRQTAEHLAHWETIAVKN